MTSTEPRDVTRRLYTALADGDAATVAKLVHPAATMSVPGTNPVAGRYEGAAGLARFVAASAAIVPGGVRTQIIEVMGGDRHAAVYGISRAARPGRPPLENHTVHLVTVDEGLITSIAIYNQDQPTVDAFWA
ncbi:nuclear transport factor 2 family protein [Micromonospora sp. Llam7]|uniref:nuclear transport factor 2 family protein n=1 Tax=Micromonospora tarapacensis TaxID=2835305 RepID=UPI001C837EB0|nr:nuclear transport factor 2 family protein [Micromonospora tarapacensis]MBX7266370.1 nuclear transport factor 2 family protein [Micromonospora tarapacensis]